MIKFICLALALSIGAACAQTKPMEGKGPAEKLTAEDAQRMLEQLQAARSPRRVWAEDILPDLQRSRR